MEGIIIVIIIIIAFNLLNLFLKVIRGERGEQRKDILTAKKTLSGDETEAKNFWEVETTRFQAEKPENATFDQKSGDENHNEYMGVANDYAVSSPDESVKPSDLASNLKKMLGQKESLAAAVIVHEILSYPPSMQKRR